MNENLFNSESIATGKFIWWIGQIVDDTVWKDNTLPTKWKETGRIPGWADRYKVRILGRDTETKDVPDEQLEMAELLYPVTAGSGHAGSYQTSNLRKGAFVVGFYKDGIDMSEPIIMGSLSNNDQTKLAQSIPLKGFVPFSGYVKETVSVNDIPSEGSETNPRESCTSNSTRETVQSDDETEIDCTKETYLTLPSDCDKLQLGAIQVEIRKFIQDIQGFKKRVNSWKYTILRPISEEGRDFSISEYIQRKSQNVAKWVSSKIKKIIDEIQKGIVRNVNEAAKNSYYSLFPNQRPGLKKSIETANDLLACLFRRIISNLLQISNNALNAVAERFINTPLCAVENILASLLGSLTGLISSFVSSIIRPIEVLVGGIFDVSGGVINFITDLLSFLSCEEKPECPGVTGWTPWQGATKFNLGSNTQNLIQKVSEIASTATQFIDPNNFNFDLNFDNIFQNSCNVGPVFCGPPIVQFYGGGGTGASGNAIVSATGDILGVDLTSLGFGYQSAPIIRFVDNCGQGKGAVGRAVINESGEVANVIIDDPGFGYLPSPNGDLGGDGSTFATSNQTVVKRSDGKYDRPYNPGETFNVNPGDEVYSEGNTNIITQPETLTAPERTTQPINNDNYSIFLELENVVIDNPGINYNSETDRVVVTPDNGAVINASFDSFGSLTSINVAKTGVGYTERPTIEIETESGYNASFIPVLKVIRIEDEIQAPPSSQIISVVDCVGKV